MLVAFYNICMSVIIGLQSRIGGENFDVWFDCWRDWCRNRNHGGMPLYYVIIVYSMIILYLSYKVTDVEIESIKKTLRFVD